MPPEEEKVVEQEENVEIQEEDTSIRGDIDNAIAAVNDNADKEDSASMDGLLPDETGPILPEKAEKAPKEAKAGETEEAAGAKPDSTEKEEPELLSGEKEEAGDKGYKAPVGWDAKAREGWSKIPPELQQTILDREKTIASTMQETQAARQTHSSIEKLASSYAPIMAAEGVSDPIKAIQGLFETVSQLRVGSPAQKATKMAQLINHYGVDIAALDSALVGEEPAASPDSQLNHIIDEKMAPVNQLLNELQSRQQQGQQKNAEEAERAVQEFQGEFLSDVRLDMADLIDMASSRGQKMTLQDAYDKAVVLNPEIQGILSKRASDAAILGGQQNIDGKRNAASIVSGTRIGEGAGGGAMSLRETLVDAFENVDA